MTRSQGAHWYRSRRCAAGVLAMLLSGLIAGCATQVPTVPPIGTPGISLPGKVVWHDLLTPNPAGAQEFYGELLGWTFEDVGSGYTLARHDGRLVAGIAKVDKPEENGHWITHLSVQDMDAVLAHTRTSGGEVILEPFDMQGRGRVALLRDPQGAAFGVIQSSTGDPEDRERAVSEWLWDEVWTRDVPSTISFYKGVARFDAAETQVFDVTYTYLKSEGKPRFGFIEKPGDEIDPTWISYVLVDDVAAAVAKVDSLGGAVLLAPDARVRDGSVAIVTDAQGSGFVMQEDRP
ncbi:VOC family protein [Pseudomonadota bacterium]